MARSVTLEDLCHATPRTATWLSISKQIDIPYINSFFALIERGHMDSNPWPWCPVEDWSPQLSSEGSNWTQTKGTVADRLLGLSQRRRKEKMWGRTGRSSFCGTREKIQFPSHARKRWRRQPCDTTSTAKFGDPKRFLPVWRIVLWERYRCWHKDECTGNLEPV